MAFVDVDQPPLQRLHSQHPNVNGGGGDSGGEGSGSGGGGSSGGSDIGSLSLASGPQVSARQPISSNESDGDSGCLGTTFRLYRVTLVWGSRYLDLGFRV